MTLSDVLWFAGKGFLAVAFFLIMVHLIGSEIISTLSGTSAITDTSAASVVLNDGQLMVNQLDKLAIVWFFAVILGIIITSWFVAGHPVGMILYFFGGLMALLVAVLNSELWEAVTTNTIFVKSLPSFAFADHVMINFPVYVGVVWFIGLLITYVKPQAFGGGGEVGF